MSELIRRQLIDLFNEKKKCRNHIFYYEYANCLLLQLENDRILSSYSVSINCKGYY